MEKQHGEMLACQRNWDTKECKLIFTKYHGHVECQLDVRNDMTSDKGL